ncbi:MAG: hypothetical protein ACRD63_11260 [Pyrinomonadaceae bacterium]
MPSLTSEVSYIVTLVAPTGDHEGTSCPQMVFIGIGGTSALGMTVNSFTHTVAGAFTEDLQRFKCSHLS